MRVLVTGFSAFPGVPDNPTERLVEALAGEGWAPPGVAALQTLVLRTEYAAAAAALDAALSALDPEVVVGFGVHATAETLRVERVARNRIAGARPDNAGIIPSAVAVDGGPLALSGTFAAPLVYDRVRAVGVPVRLSHDAGTYLCNYAYYRALHWNRDRGGAVGFVHVPPAEIVAVPTLVSAAKAAIEAAVAAKRSVPTAPASA